MKIALVAPYDYPYPGGVTEHIHYLDREFRAHGHYTRILAASSAAPDALAANVDRVSHKVHSIPLNGSNARISLSSEVPLRVAQTLSREHFDIVHLHEPAAPLVCSSALYYSSAVNVGTFHGYVDKNRFYKYAHVYMKWVCSHLDGSIFVSPIVRNAVAPYLKGESRVIPNGVDCSRFSEADVRPIPEFEDGRPNILFLGRLEVRKGFQHLLRAFITVQAQIPEARLVVVGPFSGHEAARFSEQVPTEVRRGINFIGRVTREDLPRYYRTATLFCAPSTCGESFGVVLLEAMAAGIPVVASDIVGYRQVMQSGCQGWLVPPADEATLACAILELLRDPNRRALMARHGRAAAAEYDWKVIAPRVLEYYDDLSRRQSARDRARRARVLSSAADFLQFLDRLLKPGNRAREPA